ncbi:hypothetical protein BN2497_2581 [Janthinobacterium sp. CG23_2]|nr:hypothetical protein BN2497_59 [Janthinobacterium sp. CG23_2]CUI03902.1 hypothetical protein BN2497_2581 [Janthinobacterium sp. CG23_2]CUU26427.1 hypothetical protein BN3177_59 [Janthinobacterium sp. CG23_2]CUU27688.1 hypothetical protein BN3177_2581 [Janthinobacterium sp. CG23_2]
MNIYDLIEFQLADVKYKEDKALPRAVTVGHITPEQAARKIACAKAILTTLEKVRDLSKNPGGAHG